MSEQAVTENTDPTSLNDEATVLKVRRFFSILAIVLILIAQIQLFTAAVREDIGMPASCYFSMTPFSFYCNVDGVSSGINTILIFLIAGVVLFVLSQAFRPPRFLLNFFSDIEIGQAMPWVIASLVLSFLAVVTMQLFEKAKLTNYIPVITLWFFAGAAYLGAFVQWKFSLADLRAWFKLHAKELLGIGLILLLGIALRFYQLGNLPRVVNGDEGRVGVAALSTITYPFVNPFALWENFGALYLQTINLLLSLFGSNPFSLRLVAALGGSFAILAVYLLARQISGPRVALIAAALIAISHSHIHFSRTVAVAYIQGTWLIPLEFYFLLSGITNRSSWRTALGGMLLAFHYSVYLDAQIITALLIVYLVISFIFLRSWIKPALSQVAVFWGGFGIMFLPELTFILGHPKEFLERLSKDGMFQSGWLPDEIMKTGANVWQILIQRVIHTFLSLIYYPSFDFYGSSVPVLSLVSAVLFLIGLGIVFWKTRSPGFLILNGHFWSGVLAIALFSLPASADSYRLLIVLPVALIMAAIGLDYVLDVLGLGWKVARPAYASIVSAILLSVLVFNMWMYYADFLGRCKYGSDDGPTRFASYLGNYARDLDIDHEVYLLSDAIYTNGTHQSVAFLSHNRNIINIIDPMTAIVFKPGAVVVASPNRIPELQGWAETHPEGKVHSEYDCGTLMLLTYQFP